MSTINHPPLVLAAGRGDLNEVRRLLADGDPVDSCARWTETEMGSWFNEKSWTWNADTPLCAALRGGHVAVVCDLLKAGANTTFRVCNRADVHESPETIAFAIQSEFPEAAELVLLPRFEKSRVDAERSCAAAETLQTASLPSLLDLASKALVYSAAADLLTTLPTGTRTIGAIIATAQGNVVIALPDAIRAAVTAAWAHRENAKEAAAQALSDSVAVAGLYSTGQGVRADSDSAAAWLSRGLDLCPIGDDCLDCVGCASECWSCAKWSDARKALIALRSSASGDSLANGAASSLPPAKQKKYQTTQRRRPVSPTLATLDATLRSLVAAEVARQDAERQALAARRRAEVVAAESERLAGKRARGEFTEPSVTCWFYASSSCRNGRSCPYKHELKMY